MSASSIELTGALKSETKLVSMRLDYLDSIRGLAALSVVGSHYIGAYGIPIAEDIWHYSPLHILFDGAAAVSMFFVLSGFVLAFKYLHPRRNNEIPEIHYAGYVVSRICRIWIPFLATLLLSAIAQRLIMPAPISSLEQAEWAAKFWTSTPDANHLIKQALFSRQDLTMQLIPQDWTLRYELLISLMLPVAILLARRSTLWLIGITVYAIVVLHVSPFFLHFMSGVILAKRHYQIIDLLSRNKTRYIALAIGLVLYTFQFTIPHYMSWQIKEPVMYSITGAGSVFLLAFIFTSENTKEALLHPAVHYIGTVSYSIYLSHMIILLGVTPYVLAALPDSLPIHWVTGLTATIAITIALSSILYQFVELPSIALGKKLANLVMVINDRTDNLMR
jgi:peptidoglycan/LPS O-acetylase OafA/YrhL